MKSTTLSLTLVLAFSSVVPALAGTVSDQIGDYEIDLEITCETLGNGWVTYRSLDPGTRDKDTNNDGYFFRATWAQNNLPIIFHKRDEVYKFGFLGLGVTPPSFEIADTMRRQDGPEYDVALNIAG